MTDSPQTVYIIVWCVDGLMNAQAYSTREVAERDFQEFALDDADIIESTVQS